MKHSEETRAKFQARIDAFTGQISDISYAFARATGLARHIVAQLFADAIQRSPELGALVIELAQYRAFRPYETKPGAKSEVVDVSRDRAAGARQDAVRLLAVAFGPDAHEDDVRFAEEVRDLALSRKGLLQKVIQEKGTRPEDERFVFEEEPPLPYAEPWQIALAKIFEGHGFIKFKQPLQAVRQILEALVRSCGEPPHVRFLSALDAMQRVGSLDEIPAGDDHDRIDAAMKFVESLYDATTGEVFISWDGGGGNRDHKIYMPWGAASRFSHKFGVPMPPRPRRA